MALSETSSKVEYSALSTDIVDNKIVGLDNPYTVNCKVYIKDTKVWKIVNPDYTLSDYIINSDLQAGDIQIGAVEIKDATSSNRAIVGSDGSFKSKIVSDDNTARVIADGSLEVSTTDIISGSATSGSQTTLVDTTKEFIVDMLTGTIIEIDIGSTKYFRKITSNTIDTITFPTLPGAYASAIIGTGNNGTVTISSATQGIGGNSYTVEVVQATDPNINMSAVLTGLDLLITLGTDGAGATDNAKNTATLIATAIDALEQFTAVASGTGADVVAVKAKTSFTGGIAIVSPSAGIPYKIKSTKTINNPVPITSQSATSSASHTRPNNTTLYTALDVIGTDPATNLTFSNVYPVSGAEIIINRVELMINTSSIPAGMSSFKLHLYDSAPTAITDNLVFNIPSADRTKYLGYIDIDMPTDYGDTLYVDMKGVNCQVKLANGSTALYGMLQTIGGFTPTAQCVKTIKLHTLGV